VPVFPHPKIISVRADNGILHSRYSGKPDVVRIIADNETAKTTGRIIFKGLLFNH